MEEDVIKKISGQESLYIVTIDFGNGFEVSLLNTLREVFLHVEEGLVDYCQPIQDSTQENAEVEIADFQKLVLSFFYRNLIDAEYDEYEMSNLEGHGRVFDTWLELHNAKITVGTLDSTSLKAVKKFVNGSQNETVQQLFAGIEAIKKGMEFMAKEVRKGGRHVQS